jgi:chorismate mutase
VEDRSLPLMISSLLAGTAAEPRASDTVVVRLATTCREDSVTAIAEAVNELVTAFHQRNDVGTRAVRLVIFTATGDLRSAKPATAARAAGWTDAQFLCLAEMPTDSDLPRCIRALLFVDRGHGADPLRAVYLHGTHMLRPDVSFD